MILDADCVRDVMLAVEEVEFNERLTAGKLSKKLPKYELEQINYTCLKLEEGGLLEINKARYMHQPMPTVSTIHGLTFKGHEVLDKIRDNKFMALLKKSAIGAGGFSISLLLEFIKNLALNIGQ